MKANPRPEAGRTSQNKRKRCPARQPPSRTNRRGACHAGQRAVVVISSSLDVGSRARVSLDAHAGVGVYRELVGFLISHSDRTAHHLPTSPACTAPLHWFSGVGSGAWADFARTFDVSLNLDDQGFIRVA